MNKSVQASWFLFILVMWVYVTSPIVFAPDARWALHVAMSVLTEHNVDLDEYTPLVNASGAFAVERVDGHLYSRFPIGGPLLALPVVLAVQQLSRYVLDFDLAAVMQHRFPERLGGFAASLMVALTAVLVFQIARRAPSSLPEGRARSLGVPLLVALVFAFGTSAWSTASRGLWQHGPSMLMLATTLYLALLAREKPALIQLAGFTVAYSFVIRPTNAVTVVLFTAFVALRHRRHLPGYLACAAVVAVAFVGFNFAVYHSLLAPYYRPDDMKAVAEGMGGKPQFFKALLAHLVSPGRGLLLFSPVLVLCPVGAWRMAREGQLDGLGRCLLAILLVHWALISNFPVWWAGHCFGPRFFADMLPFLAYFLVPAASALVRPGGARRIAFAALFLVLTAASVFAHSRGAYSPAVLQWNMVPDNIDWEGRPRLWDFGDIQFLRGVIHS